MNFGRKIDIRKVRHTPGAHKGVNTVYDEFEALETPEHN